MEITNEKLYEMYTGLKADNEKLYRMHVETRAELKTEISQLRSDIAKWGVALFAGSIIVMTTILGVIIVSVAS